MNKPQMSDEEKGFNRSGYIHIAFSLGSKDAVDVLTERMKNDGYNVISGPRTTGDGCYESCVIGIEGNQIEIIEEEQNGKERADYGKYILNDLSSYLTEKYGKGFSVDNLKLMRKFYNVYSKDEIGETLFPKFKNLPTTETGRKFFLSWSHYIKLMRIENIEERHFYEIEAARNDWSLTEFKRQFNTSLYERLALSRDKEGVKKLATQGQVIEEPSDLIKDPYVLEFLGLPELVKYSETDLEKHIIDNLQQFLLELGKGFTFVGRQVRLTFEEEHFRCDLVNTQIFASKYQTVLPSKEELQKLLNSMD